MLPYYQTTKLPYHTTFKFTHLTATSLVVGVHEKMTFFLVQRLVWFENHPNLVIGEIIWSPKIITLEVFVYFFLAFVQGKGERTRERGMRMTLVLFFMFAWEE